MNDPRSTERVRRVLGLLAEHLERIADGDLEALEALSAALEDPALDPEDVRTASWVLRSLENVAWDGEAEVFEGDPAGAGEGTPAAGALRVLSAEERDSLGPEAWGYLLGLWRRGALDAGQLERVLDQLVGSGIRPVSLAQARDVAASVALKLDPEDYAENLHGDLDVAN